ncbi:MAG: hypothetical protein IPK70_12900 [Flavobacteriales bacterium]|jgi:uncharacterized protein (TIGR02145 family)|nr:hypothetical protein [Flavobacteriales bacterium]
MKHLLLLLAVIATQAQAQIIVITFEGTVNGAPTPLDSILVMNLTQGGDTTIYFPDNVLVLGTTGINDAGNPGPAMQGMPNPFAGSTEVVFDAMGGMALITLHDVAGRELLSQAANLEAGTHRFRVSCERPGVHLLTVVQGGVRSSLRLMATEGAGVACLSLMGGSDRGAPKSDRSLFTWTPGDELRYIGYATSGVVLHSAAIDEVPVATATRTFVMAAGAVCPASPTVTDIDGNTYPVVQIGDQCWMAANLSTSRYRNGDDIPNVTSSPAWGQLTTAAWCSYSNDASNDATYGKLYNWYAAANPNICPQGWHMPTDAEWQQMELALGMPTDELNGELYRGRLQNVGGKMKATTLWDAPNTGATNETGFSGLPASYRNHNGFYLLGRIGYWWTATEYSSGGALIRGLSFVGPNPNDTTLGIERRFMGKILGGCLRCVMD